MPLTRSSVRSDLPVTPRLSQITQTIGPLALVLLINAGQLKASPLLAWLPIDLTLLAAALCLAIAVYARITEGPVRRAAYVPIVFLLLAVPGVALSSLVEYSQIKVLTLYSFTAVLLFTPFALLRTLTQRRVFIVGLLVISAFVGAVALIAPQAVADYSSRAVFEGTNTIGTGRIAGTGAAICLILAIGLRTRLAGRLLLVGAAGLLTLALVNAGSRGPFLAIVAAVAVTVVLAPQFARFRARAIISTVVVGLGVLVWALNQEGDGAVRVLSVLSSDENTSSDARLYLWQQALRAAQFHPLGIGWGEFYRLPGLANWASEGNQLYPHNIVIEAFLEGGWLFGLALVVLLIAAIVRSRQNAVGTVNSIIFALLVFALVNAMVSGDLNENRLLWALVAAGWAVAAPVSGMLSSSESLVPTSRIALDKRSPESPPSRRSR